MVQKILKKYLLFSAVMLSCLLAVFSQASPVNAQSIKDYYSIIYTAQFSKLAIVESEPFSVTITGSANCIKDLPVAVIKASLTGSIVAVHQMTRARVILNPGYTVNIDPFPNRAGQTAQSTQVVPVQFSGNAQTGTYDIFGEFIQAKIYYLQWWDAPFLPSPQNLGSLSYSAPAPSGGSPGGGGGGVQTPADSQTTTTFDISRLVTAASEGTTFIEEFVVKSSDSKFMLTINQGTRAFTPNRAPLTRLVKSEVKEIPPAPANFTTFGTTYEIGPAGATFEPPIILSLTYDPANLPQGLDEKKLVIATWDADTGVWNKLPSTVNTTTRTVHGLVPHFSYFTVMGSSKPGSFSVSDLSITPSEVDIDGVVAISIQVINTGDLAGSYKLTLSIDGTATNTKDITLSGGERQQVTFTATRKFARRYEVSVNGLSGTFTVKPQLPPPTPETPVTTPAPVPEPGITSAPPEAQTPEPVTQSEPTRPATKPVQTQPLNIWLIVGIFLVFLLAILVARRTISRLRGR